ncbi:MAG: immunoglobulin domain-containing protein [Verrucomicrobia bacterium]|nr:immunoglobulin domain-containing protein [Verrucomicrobiota bacterium]
MPITDEPRYDAQKLRPWRVGLLMAALAGVPLPALPGHADDDRPPAHGYARTATFPTRLVAVGSDVTLQIETLPPPQVQYAWKLNGQLIPGARKPQLELKQIGPADGGLFSLVIQSKGNVTETFFPVIVAVDELPFADDFNRRGRVSGSWGYGASSNADATREKSEPTHAGKGKGKSIWLAWVAPADGPVSFSTAGSSFDTVLAVYTGKQVKKLALVASDDDGSGYATSAVTFNARAGVEYAIAVDGTGAARADRPPGQDEGITGSVSLVWDQAPRTALPEIRTALLPEVIVANVGDTVRIPLPAELSGAPAVTWYRIVHNTHVQLSTVPRPYPIPRLSADDVGPYYFELRTAAGTVRSPWVDLQLNTQGDTTAAVYGKLADAQARGGNGLTRRISLVRAAAPELSALGRRVRPLAGDPNSGYTGNQVFQNLPGKDIGEPNHCGELGGSSYWFAYTAPAAGTVTLDTIGSNFPTVLAVYYDDGLGKGYASLVPVVCGVVNYDGHTACRVSFVPDLAKTYYIVVDGFDGLNGTAWLNYQLTP